VGTANLVAREASMPLRADPERLAAAVLRGETFAVDLLSTDRGLAVANFGAGLDAEVVHAVAHARAGRIGGYARWVLPIARTVMRHAPRTMEVRVDGGPPLRGGAVVVQNTRTYGGLFTLAPWARADDGRLDAMVVLRGTRRDHLRMLAGAFFARLPRDHGVRFASGSSVEISSSAPVAIQVDGDPAGTTPIRAHVVPKALTLVRGVA
jgi:diacylglycerol kinase family enzyme